MSDLAGGQGLEQVVAHDVRQLAVAAPGLPAGVVGWARDSALRAVDSLYATKVAIVTVAVFESTVLGFLPADECWECEPASGEPPWDFAARSRQAGLEWIRAFPRDHVLFTLEVSTQDQAVAAVGRPGGSLKLR